MVAGVDAVDCAFRLESLVDNGLLEPCEFDDGLFVELQLLGLLDWDLLDVLPPHGDSEPDRDFFFLVVDDLDEHSVSDVRRSVVVSYALSGVTAVVVFVTLP